MPATRHFWWWLGVRPIDKANIHKLLESNNSVVLVPGGNTECRMMKHGQETLYLRKRLGFVRLAMNHGAPLVPAFAFGQTDTYSYDSFLPLLTSCYLVSCRMLPYHLTILVCILRHRILHGLTTDIVTT